MALFRFHSTALLATLSLIVCGCGGGAGASGLATDPVSGSVKYKGAAVADATVTFIPLTGTVPAGSKDPATAGRTAVAKTDAAGEFKLTTIKPNDGALPGDYKITVTKLEPTVPVTPSTDIAAPPPKVTPPKSLLPAKYGNADATALKATVKKGGPNRVDLSLED